MSQSINLAAIFIADIMAVIVSIITIAANRMMLEEDSRDGKIFKAMFCTAILSCIADLLASVFDGRQGMMTCLVIYACNFLLFFSNMVIGPLWIALISNHTLGDITKKEKIVIRALCCLGMIFLIINFFTPVVFGIDNGNRYFRGPAFFLYVALELIFLLAGIAIYYYAKMKGGIFKTFPIWLFLGPVILGIAAQSLVYGISTMWAGVSISIMGILSEIRNEMVYRDQLTGLYNRYYLDYIWKTIIRRKKDNITVVMMDINNFKTINDTYGHQEGDTALQTVAETVTKCVGAMGSTIRYGGDEFLVLLNTQSKESVENCIDSIHRALDRWNASGKKLYLLTLSMGYESLDIENQMLDDILIKSDQKMYEAKIQYYRNHDRRKSENRDSYRK